MQLTIDQEALEKEQQEYIKRIQYRNSLNNQINEKQEKNVRKGRKVQQERFEVESEMQKLIAEDLK